MDLLNDTWSEQHRHQCEVRWCLSQRALRGVNWLREYLAKDVVKPRKLNLERDILDQWTKGNRGHNGEWK